MRLGRTFSIPAFSMRVMLFLVVNVACVLRISPSDGHAIRQLRHSRPCLQRCRLRRLRHKRGLGLGIHYLHTSKPERGNPSGSHHLDPTQPTNLQRPPSWRGSSRLSRAIRLKLSVTSEVSRGPVVEHFTQTSHLKCFPIGLSALAVIVVRSGK